MHVYKTEIESTPETRQEAGGKNPGFQARFSREIFRPEDRREVRRGLVCVHAQNSL